MHLRLFPLAQTVLFPGAPLRLQVFEPRYRQLVAECVRDAEPFGVVLIREGSEVGGPAVPYDLGTTARIRNAQTQRDGRLHLDTVGERRFRILELHDHAPFQCADVEYVRDERVEVAADALGRARDGVALLRRLASLARGEYERDPRVPEAAGAIADAIAGLISAPPERLQRLLEITNVADRLDAVLPYLDATIAEARLRTSAAAASRWAAFGMAN